jgi:voltage-gated potassium channel
MSNDQDVTNQVIEQERWEILAQLEDWLEAPMFILGFVWLALLIVELVWGLSPLLERAILLIWIIFIVDFSIKMILAPRKWAYLRRNWLTLLALAVPALRVLRVVRLIWWLRVARAARSINLLRIVTSVNRGLRVLRTTFSRRGFTYVAVLTIIVTLAGAAGIFAFEREVEGGPDSYGIALWWTAMIMTTMGSDFWPRTAEGRLLVLLLALYSFAMFGYVTATLATFFIGRDAADQEAELAGAQSIAELRAEISALREELRTLLQAQPPSQPLAPVEPTHNQTQKLDN